MITGDIAMNKDKRLCMVIIKTELPNPLYRVVYKDGSVGYEDECNLEFHYHYPDLYDFINPHL